MPLLIDPLPRSSPSNWSDRRVRDRLEILEEENRQLKARIAKLEGRHEIESIRRAFNLTASEAAIFALLLHCGFAEYQQLTDAIYEHSDLIEPDCPSWAIRCHLMRMRRKTRPFGIDFQTIYGMGFRMSEEARGKARKLLKQADAV